MIDSGGPFRTHLLYTTQGLTLYPSDFWSVLQGVLSFGLLPPKEFLVKGQVKEPNPSPFSLTQHKRSQRLYDLCVVIVPVV